MRTSKQKPAEEYQRLPTIQTPKLPPTPEQINQRAQDIYVARGGAEGMTLNDWLQAEQELKHQLEDEGQWLQSRFKHPSEYQVRLVASLVTLRACQQQGEEADWFPAVDISETGEEYFFTVDLPGLTPQGFQVYVENDVLSIAGERITTHETRQPLRIERPRGPFVRHFALPDDASRMEIRATLKDGVLELCVRKMSPADGNTQRCQRRNELRIEPSN